MLTVFAAVVAFAAGGASSDGPWRQLIHFQATAGRPDGASLWITEASVLATGSAVPGDVRTAEELWVVHGATVGDQAYTILSKRYDCGRGEIFTDAVEVFARDGRRLGEAGPQPEPGYPQVHSAEAEAFDAVCSTSRRAVRGALVSTTAAAVEVAGPGRVIEPVESLSLDMDHDGEADTVRVALRPHSFRHDVEIVLASQANRTINVVLAEQPAAGPIVARGLRPVERDRYLIACNMADGRDVEPCDVEYPLMQGGVEVAAPGQPSFLVWLDGNQARVARLP
jgi:hypothetical protein